MIAQASRDVLTFEQLKELREKYNTVSGYCRDTCSCSISLCSVKGRCWRDALVFVEILLMALLLAMQSSKSYDRVLVFVWY